MWVSKTKNQGGWAIVMLLMVIGFASISCSTFEDSGLPGSASSMARNQIMWVDKDSQSFGYYRLESQRRVYADLEVFLRQKGAPDFLAETSDDRRRYFMLYYLDLREAFACRTAVGRNDLLEFSGPYPIGDREAGKLRHMKNGKTSAPAGMTRALPSSFMVALNLTTTQMTHATPGMSPLPAQGLWPKSMASGFS